MRLKRMWRKLKAFALQRYTALRFFFTFTLRGEREPRVVFIHIPKTGGNSSVRHVAQRVGWRRTGRSAHLSEIPWEPQITPERIALANKAFFVWGHMSFSTVEALEPGRRTFAYAFLREPKSRIWSMYRHANTHQVKMPVAPTHPIYDALERCAKMSAEEFFLTDEYPFRFLVDNFMVRQFSTKLTDYPIEESRWPELLQKAKANLAKLDFVGFQETYDEDFRALLPQIHMPAPKQVPRSNPALPNDARSMEPVFSQPAIAKVVDDLVKWDMELYRFAVERFQRPRQGGASQKAATAAGVR
jgi:hypothetical protein